MDYVQSNEEEREALQKLSQARLQYLGAVSWQREDSRLNFRAEWRVQGDDLVYNFYHKNGVDVNYIEEDGKLLLPETSNQDDRLQLNEAFAEILKQVCSYLWGENMRIKLDYLPELRCWQLVGLGRAVHALSRDRYTLDLFAILDANLAVN